MDCRHRAIMKRIAILMTMIAVMLVLCGCRTRITNNNEVSNVMYDESGYMQEEYDMRRDDLDLSTAEKPLFTGLGGPTDEEYEEEYGDEDSQMLEDYDPEAYEEDYEEPETETAENSGTTRQVNNSSVQRRTVRRTTTTTTTTMITVTMNANGGKSKTSSIKVKKGSTYGSLPTPTRKGYEFDGWYTSKNGGSKVTKNTKVTKSQNHTLYAHWTKEKEETKEETKEYTVKFDLNAPDATFTSGGSDLTVKDGDTYGSLPKAERPKYKLKGWSTSSTGTGSTVSSGDKVTKSLTLYAVWEDDPDYYYSYWTKELKNSVPSKDSDKYRYKILGDDGGTFLQDSGMTKGKDDCDYLVFFGSKEDARKKDKAENKEKKQIIVIPKEAIKGSTKDEAVLLYKLKLFDTIYGAGIGVDQAESELGVTVDGDIEIIDSEYSDDSGGGGEGGDTPGGDTPGGDTPGEGGSGETGGDEGGGSGSDEPIQVVGYRSIFRLAFANRFWI